MAHLGTIQESGMSNSNLILGSDSDSSQFEYPGASQSPTTDNEDEDEFVYPGSESAQQAAASAPRASTSSNSRPSPAQLESLFAASSSGDLSLLKKLFANATENGDVQPFSLANDASMRTGSTALHAAASKGYLDCVAWLVEECGAMPDLEDREGETALHKAALNGHLPVLTYLLPDKAEVHAKDADGWTALHNACSKGYLDIVRFLCEKGGAASPLHDGTKGVDVGSKGGWTPLMNASSKGHLPVVRYLLSKQHANPMMRNNWGETAYDTAAAVFEIFICDVLQTAESSLFPRSQPSNGNGAYDPLAVHTTIPLVLYENQRLDTRLKTLAVNGGKPKFSASGLRANPTSSTSPSTSRAPQSTAKPPFELRSPSNKTKLTPAWRSDVQLPLLDDPFKLPPAKMDPGMEGRERSCFWLSDWTLDTTHPSTDPTTGWSYARSFNVADNEWTPEEPIIGSATSPTTAARWVRRRRWVRVMRRRLDVPPLPFLQPDGKLYHLTAEGSLVPPEQSIGHMAQEDYVSQARRLVDQKFQTDTNGMGDDAADIRKAILKLDRAVKELRQGILIDEDPERRIQAEVLLHAYSRELDRRRSEANARGLIISGADEDFADDDRISSDDDEEFHYPGAGSPSPSTWDRSFSPTPWSSSSRPASVYSTDYFTTGSSRPNLSRTGTSSSSRAIDLTPHLLQAPEFRVPTHEAPQKVNAVTTPRLTPAHAHATWERDEAVQSCRDCSRRFTFILRRHHCRRCGRIFCDRCSSYRAILDPSEIVQDPSDSAYPGEQNSHATSSRVCQQCFDETSGRIPAGLQSSGIRGIERIVINHERLYSRSNHLGRGHSSSQLSDLAECPVCNENLDDVGSPAQQEAHVKLCLEGGNAPGLQSAKYLVYTLPSESTLIGVECVICLEEFELGSRIARLSCLCSFHSSCLSAWLQRGKTCPVHAR